MKPADIRSASRAERRAELEVYRHGLSVAVDVEKDHIDARALGEVVRCAAHREMDFIDEGLAIASGNPAKLAIVADKAEVLRRTNNARIERRFG